MKKIIIGVVVLVVVLLLVFGRSDDQSSDVALSSILSASADITRYTLDGATSTNHYGFIEFSFPSSHDGEKFAQALLDVNGDGTFSDDEWVVQNQPARIVADFPNRFSFSLPPELQNTELGEVSVLITLTDALFYSMSGYPGETLTLSAPVNDVTIVEEFGLNVPGASEELKRGVGTVAYAQGSEVPTSNISTDALPDLAGGPMDCFAIATANNLINMASQHGRRDELPADPNELVAELKNAMQWDDGILNPNFLTGKADYVAAMELPITTEEIKRPSLEQLQEALANGDAVEVSTVMIRSRSGKANTGHVFTGVSAGESGLSVHDPATPNGTDTLNTSMTGGETPFIMLEYPLWDGLVLIDFIYIQHWNEPEEEESEESSGVSLEEEEVSVETRMGVLDTFGMGVAIETSFAHVSPGQYSEVYASAAGFPPNVDLTARLSGGGHTGTPQVVTTDENGVAYFTWRISQYGEYEVILYDIDDEIIEKSQLTVN